jgi:hypothetical protein
MELLEIEIELVHQFDKFLLVLDPSVQHVQTDRINRVAFENVIITPYLRLVRCIEIPTRIPTNQDATEMSIHIVPFMVVSYLFAM